MASHTVYLPDLQTRSTSPTEGTKDPAAPTRVLIGGDEAKHTVRVKRLEVGDTVTLRDGKGASAVAGIVDIRKEKRSGEWVLEVEYRAVVVAPALTPRLTVLTGAPKGDAIEQMIDGLSQVGAARWAPLLSVRSVVEPREGKLRRLERVAEEALKQSGRERVLEIGENTSLEWAVSGGGALVVADSSGGKYVRTGAERITLLVGPEGGWDPRELEKLRGAGAQVAAFGPYVMRIEVAAVVCAACVMGAERAGC